MSTEVEYVLFKTCTECGTEKPRTKFYKHPAMPDGLMPHCKACHNGCTEMHQRQEIESREWQWGDPTEADIRRACEQIRQRWTDKQRQRARDRATKIGGVA